MVEPIVPNDPRAVEHEAPRAPIVKATGQTESEQYLAKLGDHSFLNLWSYPNPFTDRGTTRDGDAKARRGDGKELCDLLVVCGDHVIIFSDKTIAWPGGDEQIAWKRWYKRAIASSTDQVRGAARWLREFPDRIFLDRKCTEPLPIKLPPLERRKVHGIVVALGAGEACREHFGEGIGSLMVISEIKGDDHWKPDQVIPFCIGDVDPSGPFVHVLDDATLDIIMGELDTITDFTDYLQKKEAFVRSGKLLVAGGEEDLLAYYMLHMNAKGVHDFVKPDGSAFTEYDGISLHTGWYQHMLNHPQYLAKKAADKISYFWDRLTERFTTHILDGTTIVPEGHDASVANIEQGVRHMALANRFKRRILSEAIGGAIRQGGPGRRFARALLPGPTDVDPETGYCFMTLAVPDFQLDGGYEQYRKVRTNMLEVYGLTFLQRNPQLKRIVGIATEPPTSESGGSEDLIVIEPPEWTPEFLKELEEKREAYEIAKEGRYQEHSVQTNEYPEVIRRPRTTAQGAGNRKERRAAAAKARKKAL